MSMGRAAWLVATRMVLLGVDTLAGVSGTLYGGPAAGFALLGFLVAVVATILAGNGPLLFLLHDAAPGYFWFGTLAPGRSMA